MRGRVAMRALAAVASVLAVACAAPTQHSGSAVRTPSTGSAQVWLAVYDTAADPQDLAEERTQMLSALGDALDGAVVISPAGCFEGLPPGIHADVYVLALQQAERVYVRALAEQLDGHPRFVGEVTISCTD